MLDHDSVAFSNFLSDLQDYLSRHTDSPRDLYLHTRPQQPLRQVLLDGLHDIGYPMTSQTLRVFVEARFGRSIPATQMGTLAWQERRAFDHGGSGARPVWIANGVRSDDFHGVRRINARSDWPMDWRMVTSMSERIQHLRVTSVLCQYAAQAEELAQNPRQLERLALSMAQDLPGVHVDATAPQFDVYASLATELYLKYDEDDRPLRERAASELKALPERIQLFGRGKR